MATSVKRFFSSANKPLISEVQNRLAGCLLGQAIGDALGARYEFEPAIRVTSMIESEKVHGHLPLLGGGHLKLVPGQVTDDTELALALARSIVKKGTYDEGDVCDAYCTWYQVGIGIGRTTWLTLMGTEKLSKQNRLKLARANSQKLNQGSLSNGCLMRISPLAMAAYNWPVEELLTAARSNCSITNPNPIAQDAVAAYVAGVHTALHTGDAKQAYETACKTAKAELVQRILKAAQDAPEPVELTDGTMVRTGDEPTIGFLGIALQNAFYELLHRETFEKSLIDITRRGGDTDTNGCIAGALIGAQVGLQALPQDWVDTVLSADVSARVALNPDAQLNDLKQLAEQLPMAKSPKE